MLFGIFDLATAFSTGYGYGVANVFHYCPYDVYCGVVVGCAPGTPPGQCPGADLEKLDAGVNITVPFAVYETGVGITIM